MTAEEYEKECNRLIMDYFQKEERITAKAKRNGIWSKDLYANDYLFYKVREEMHAKLAVIRNNYRISPFIKGFKADELKDFKE